MISTILCNSTVFLRDTKTVLSGESLTHISFIHPHQLNKMYHTCCSMASLVVWRVTVAASSNSSLEASFKIVKRHALVLPPAKSVFLSREMKINASPYYFHKHTHRPPCCFFFSRKSGTTEMSGFLLHSRQ